MRSLFLILIILLIFNINFINCSTKTKSNDTNLKELIDQYSIFKLETNIDHLKEMDKKMLIYLFKASKIMDDIFWFESIGKDKKTFLKSLKSNKLEIKYSKINYGPWDKFTNEPFIKGYGERPKGSYFYPIDITENEFNNFNNSDKYSLYTILNRDDKDGKLITKWYHEEWSKKIEDTALLLEKASKFSSNKSFKKYLKLRANAIRTDNYYESDLAWMELTDNPIDIVIGPIENYADGFKGIKTAHSAQILIKDFEWSKKIEIYNSMLPELQLNLPVDIKYKSDQTSKGDMFVYYLIYCKGDSNSGPKNIAINLPNDPKVQLVKGSRKLQLKNAIQAKFERILIPMAKILIDESQLKHVVFDDGFFQNTMFHEIAHGLGVKFLINDKNTSVHTALEETYSPLEEAKADITGIFFIQYLVEKGQLKLDIMDCYTSFLAGVLRSVRFGSESAHGKANMISYNFITELGGFKKSNGKYSIDKVNMKIAVSNLVNKILTIQGDGIKSNAIKFIDQYGNINNELQESLNKISVAGIPRDIIFSQSLKNIGLKK